MSPIRITSLLLPYELREMLEMVQDAFHSSMESGYSPEGRAVFLKYASYEATLRRIQTDHRIFVASEQGRPVGMVEFRRGERISLFIVHPSSRGKGVGLRLLEAGLLEIPRIHPQVKEILINALPGSAHVLGKMGFEPAGEGRMINGTRIIPMKRSLGAGESQNSGPEP